MEYKIESQELLDLFQCALIIGPFIEEGSLRAGLTVQDSWAGLTGLRTEGGHSD